jgi:hypothetical protein
MVSSAMTEHRGSRPLHHAQYVRRAEDVDYWRKAAGWFDDDAKMLEYNNGISDTYYQPRDGNGGSSFSLGGQQSETIGLALKIGVVVVVLVLFICVIRAIARRMEEKKVSSSEGKRSSSRSRSLGRSSSSRARSSRSRSRTRGASDYEMMDDGDDGRSRKSTRSSSGRSRSKGRSSSRTRERSRSKPRSSRKPSASAATVVSSENDPVLV